jgi:hypothetical protein
MTEGSKAGCGIRIATPALKHSSLRDFAKRHKRHEEKQEAKAGLESVQDFPPGGSAFGMKSLGFFMKGVLA